MEDVTTKRLLGRLSQLRKLHGLTQEQFAELSGISYKYYQHVETGRRPQLRLPTLIRLAKAYGIGVHELLAPKLPKTTLSKRPPPRKRLKKSKKKSQK